MAAWAALTQPTRRRQVNLSNMTEGFQRKLQTLPQKVIEPGFFNV